MRDDQLRPAQRVMCTLDLALAHRDVRLAQEAPRAVVEHHDKLSGRGGKHCALTVGIRRGGQVAHGALAASEAS